MPTFERVPACNPMAHTHSTTQPHIPSPLAQLPTRPDRPKAIRTDAATQTAPPPLPKPHHATATTMYEPAQTHPCSTTTQSDNATTTPENDSGSDALGARGEDTSEMERQESLGGKEEVKSRWADEEEAVGQYQATTGPAFAPRDFSSLKTSARRPWTSLRCRTRRATPSRPQPYLPHDTHPANHHHCPMNNQPAPCHVIYICCSQFKHRPCG
jgi:hypothetical protein